MPRTRDEQQRQVYRCTEPFAIYRDGVPVVFGADQEVLDDDPILKTHRTHFEPAAARAMRRAQVEQTTAAPGEYRSVAPVPPVEETHE